MKLKIAEYAIINIILSKLVINNWFNSIIGFPNTGTAMIRTNIVHIIWNRIDTILLIMKLDK